MNSLFVFLLTLILAMMLNFLLVKVTTRRKVAKTLDLKWAGRYLDDFQDPVRQEEVGSISDRFKF